MPNVRGSVSEMLRRTVTRSQFARTLTRLTQYPLTRNCSRPYPLERRDENRFRLYRRNGIFCLEDTQTGAQRSLRTREPAEAARLLHARNEAAQVPMLNLALGKVYLAAHDPK